MLSPSTVLLRVYSLFTREILYFVSWRVKNSYIVLLENKRSLFSRNNRNLKKYSRKCPALKSGFLRKCSIPPLLTHLPSSLPQFKYRKFLYDHGMANNFRRVLNCVALLCCEISESQKMAERRNPPYIKKIYKILEKYTFRVRKIKVVGMVWEAFGDVGASKTIKNSNLNIKINLKHVFFIKIPMFTVFLY